MTPFRFHGLAYKYMTKMLSLTPAEMTAGMLTPLDFNRGRLQRAKGALARIGAVGLQGHFDHFCRFLAARFGRHLGEPVSLRARIAEDNAVDVELYDFAKRLLTTEPVAGYK